MSMDVVIRCNVCGMKLKDNGELHECPGVTREVVVEAVADSIEAEFAEASATLEGNAVAVAHAKLVLETELCESLREQLTEAKRALKAIEVLATSAARDTNDGWIKATMERIRSIVAGVNSV